MLINQNYPYCIWSLLVTDAAKVYMGMKEFIRWILMPYISQGQSHFYSSYILGDFLLASKVLNCSNSVHIWSVCFFRRNWCWVNQQKLPPCSICADQTYLNFLKALEELNAINIEQAEFNRMFATRLKNVLHAIANSQHAHGEKNGKIINHWLRQKLVEYLKICFQIFEKVN